MGVKGRDRERNGCFCKNWVESVLRKIKNRITVWSNNSILGYVPKRMEGKVSNGYLSTYIHSSIIHHSQKVETHLVSINSWMDKQNVVYTYSGMSFTFTKEGNSVLTGVAQLVRCCPTRQKVSSSIPSQATCLGCRPGPQLGACSRQPLDVSLVHWWFSPSLSPSCPLSLKMNK